MRKVIKKAVNLGRLEEEMNTNDKCYCLGYGWLRQDLPVGHPQFGKLIPCPYCTSGYYMDLTGLDKVEQSLYRFDELLDANGMKRAVEMVKMMIDRGWGVLLIYGDYGVGKTRLAKTIVAELARNGKIATYKQAVDIIEDIRASQSADLPAYASWYGLAIDELDLVRATEYAQEQLMRLLLQRYDGAVKKKNLTVLVSNKDIKTYSGKLQDRLRDGRVMHIELSGKSLRPALGEEDYG